jgi:transcriptional regulator with GAF, ATPase, and Fis domain
VSKAASHDRQLRSAMADLAGNFTSGAIDVDDALANVTAAAVNLIPGIDYADILLIEEGQFQSVAPTAAIVKEIDAVQQRVQEGPCLEAAVADSVIRCPDLDNDLRWPQFAPAATGLGVHSMLSYQLYSYRGGVGALNLLGSAPQQFTFEAEGLGAMLATHAAVALIAANTERQFQSALASRDNIGQAKGILMERFDIDAVQAFELLRRLSQETNTPLRALAERIITAR